MSAALHRNTPALTAVDPRGLAVRSVQYLRTQPADQPQARVNRQVFGASGLLLEQWDPRQFAHGQGGVAAQSNLYSLSGEVVRTETGDAGWRLVLRGTAGQRLHEWDSRGAHQAFHYDRQLRPTAVFEQSAQEASPRCVERMQYATASPSEAAARRCGRLIRHADPAGVLQIEAYSIEQHIIRQTRQFRADISPVDWPQSDVAQYAQVEKQAYTTTWRYDALGALLEQVDAKGNAQHRHYGQQGWLLEMALTLKGEDRQAVMDQRVYNASGQVTSERAGNGVIKVAEYSERDGRLVLLKTYRKGESTTPLQRLAYQYDPVGNILGINDLAQPTRWHSNARIEATSDYRYDTLYRLIQASGRENAAATGGQALPTAVPFGATDQGLWRNYTQHYEYDQAGNLTRLQHLPSSGAGYTREMQIAALSNRALPVAEGPSARLGDAFDGNGNLQSLGYGKLAVWNVRNQLVRVQGQSGDPDAQGYLYDSQGQRALKRWHTQEGAVKEMRLTYYLPGLQVHKQRGKRFNLLDIDTGGGRVTVVQWQSGKPAYMNTHQLHFCILDHLKSCSLTLDEQARLLSQEHYYPYGATAWWAVGNTVRSYHKVRRYSDKERDATGLYYYGSRYYAPWLQRWISPDPMGDVDGLNMYAMARGNPLRFRDADGGQATFGEQFQPGRGDMVFGLSETVFAYRSWWSLVSGRGDTLAAYFTGSQLQRWTASLAPLVRAFSSFKELAPEHFQSLSTPVPHEDPGYTRIKKGLIREISASIQPFYEGVVSRYSGCTATACNQQFARTFARDLKAGAYSLEATAIQYIGTHLSDIQTKLVSRSSKSALLTLTSEQSSAVVHFALDNLDIEAVVGKSRSSITASELRWLYRHRTQLAGRVNFYRGRIKVDAPWETDRGLWSRYTPASIRVAGVRARR